MALALYRQHRIAQHAVLAADNRQHAAPHQHTSVAQERRIFSHVGPRGAARTSAMQKEKFT
eukprot:8596414-Lingulodinium_polyedra.AAC.2